MSPLRALLRAMVRSGRPEQRTSDAAGFSEIVPEMVPLTLGGIPVSVAVASGATDQYSEWIRRGLWTEPSLHWALKIAQPDWHVLDLGAHVGTFSLTIAERCKRVVAVEAMPDNFVLLVAGTARSGGVVVPVHAAVAECSGTAAMSDRSAWARVDPLGDVMVPALSMRDVYAAYGEGGFDLIKVDIEGSEPRVLPELLELMRQGPRGALIYESNQAVSDISVQSLHADVACAGFKQWYLDPRTLEAIEVDPSRAQYTLNCDVLALRSDVDIHMSSRLVTPDFLRDQIEADLTTHDVAIHRSYAFCLAEHLVNDVGADFVSRVNGHAPTHQGARDEIARFRRILASSRTA